MGRSCNLRTVSTCTLRTVPVSCLLAHRMSPPEGSWEWRWSSSVAIEDEDIFSSLMSWRMCQSKTLVTSFSMTVQQARLSLLDQDTTMTWAKIARNSYLRESCTDEKEGAVPQDLYAYTGTHGPAKIVPAGKKHTKDKKNFLSRQHCFNIMLATVPVTSEVRAHTQHHCKGFHLTRSFSSMPSAANIMYLLAFPNYQTSKLIDTVLGKHDDSGYSFR